MLGLILLEILIKDFRIIMQEVGVPDPCQISGRHNHMAMKCFYRWDYSYKAPEDLSQALTTLSTLDVQDSNLYVDTGANAHVTNDPGKLFNIKP